MIDFSVHTEERHNYGITDLGVDASARSHGAERFDLDELYRRFASEPGFAAIVTSSSLGHACLNAARFLVLLTEQWRVRLEVDGPTASLVFDQVGSMRPETEESEFIVVATIVACRRLLTEDFMPSAIQFAHDPPADFGERHRLLGAPVMYRQVANAVRFSSLNLLTALRTSDPVTCAAMERQAAARAGRQSVPDPLVRRIEDLITRELRNGNHGAEHVAEKLGIHSRTLARWLRSRGTRYQLILDRVRYRLAVHHLVHSELPITQVAALTGYSEVGAFNRAFRRWAGMVPRDYRARGDASREPVFESRVDA